ncbi:N-formylglutamate amidohydrolase [Chondromyces crocatus]|uniref:N-formylglutamate amidohydrolase n=1 Tax=Chondromyces crocatus TaxID=52 RepID=A0A0K1E7U0_CHOCO|nr:N-formylglutamate amidohydrolase [Chondromyces crocatus]AKT36747.1 N-formylglutamate amidohydrolase [Chondromyces crocatus]
MREPSAQQSTSDEPFLGPDEPAPVEVVNEGGTSRYVLVCEHASNRLPRRVGDLGLTAAELERHIAWDLGAAQLARALGERLDAPLFMTNYSRLVIDCNRPRHSPTSIVEVSESTDIPGNVGLPEGERAARWRALFEPFRDAVTQHLDRRQAEGRPTAVIGVHSFTPVFLGIARRWQCAVLSLGAREFAQGLIERLREEVPEVGDNEPYQPTLDGDHTVPYFGDARGLPAVLFEIRQDLLADSAGIAEWSERLARVLG